LHLNEQGEHIREAHVVEPVGRPAAPRQKAANIVATLVATITMLAACTRPEVVDRGGFVVINAYKTKLAVPR
jgi:hypothetical protein